MVQIKDWFRICEDSHSDCGSKWEYHLPNRLIDLGTDDAGSLRLVRTAGLKLNRVRYTALSYCWGSLVSLTTTEAKVSAYHKDIPRCQISKTFAEAFLVTKKKGLRYIWIDALCIVQDNPDDWAAELYKMEDIYQGSVLTISANDSAPLAGGIFVQSSSFL